MVKRYTKLVADGKVKQAVRYATQRLGKGGVLQPNDMVAVDDQGTKRTVRDVLLEKHPEGLEPEPHAMPHYDSLPDLPWVVVTPEHIETAARRLQGSAGPGGANGDYCQHWLLRCGTHSAKLREAVANLASLMANKIVPWEH